jgi:hypothetical protein
MKGHIICDTMANELIDAFSAWPERLYVIRDRNTIDYVGGPGPFWYDFPDLERHLAATIAL